MAIRDGLNIAFIFKETSVKEFQWVLKTKKKIIITQGAAIWTALFIQDPRCIPGIYFPVGKKKKRNQASIIGKKFH